jgi:predicted hotdog family 3-hydroxylacyl-ACP dehydratase
MPITFSSQDVKLARSPHTGTMVLTVHIDKWDITKILINNGSRTEILFLAAFDKMGFYRKQLQELTKPLYGFDGK